MIAVKQRLEVEGVVVTLLVGVGISVTLIGAGIALSNAYCYFFMKDESFEQFLYNAFPDLEKMSEEELDALHKVIGEDPRKPSPFKWMWYV